jgi:Ca2+-binding EF-hand superfamily protein
MTPFLLCGAAAAALFATAPAFAQKAPGQPAPMAQNAPGQPAQRAHKAMKAETRADAQAQVAKHFAIIDANHDGFVSKAEVDALIAQRDAKVQQRADHFDPSKMFAKLDTNNDGKITQAEAEAVRNARIAAKGGKPAKANGPAFAGLFAKADANKDGAITRAEFDSAAAQMHARMEQAGMKHGGSGRMFETADANKDGRVSLTEMQQAALQHFDRADLNHDGTVTPEERQQARQALRGQRKPS